LSHWGKRRSDNQSYRKTKRSGLFLKGSVKPSGTALDRHYQKGKSLASKINWKKLDKNSPDYIEFMENINTDLPKFQFEVAGKASRKMTTDEINYVSRLIPIENFDSVTFFIDRKGNKGIEGMKKNPLVRTRYDEYGKNPRVDRH